MNESIAGSGSFARGMLSTLTVVLALAEAPTHAATTSTVTLAVAQDRVTFSRDGPLAESISGSYTLGNGATWAGVASGETREQAGRRFAGAQASSVTLGTDDGNAPGQSYAGTILEYTTTLVSIVPPPAPLLYVPAKVELRAKASASASGDPANNNAWALASVFVGANVALQVDASAARSSEARDMTEHFDLLVVPGHIFSIKLVGSVITNSASNKEELVGTALGSAEADPVFSFDQQAFEDIARAQGFAPFALGAYFAFEDSAFAAAVPEPASTMLMLVGLALLACCAARRRCSADGRGGVDVACSSFACKSCIGRVSRMGLALAAACLGALHQPAYAALELRQSSGSATASVDFFGTSLPSATDTESFGPFGGVATAEVGRTRAVQTGSGLNAVNAEGRLSDIPGFALRAETRIDQRVVNSGSTAEAVAFQYLINGGELRLFSPSGSFDGLEATVGVSIFTLGASDFSGSLWRWGVTLYGSEGSLEAQVHGFDRILDFDDPLGLGMPGLSAITVASGEAVLSIASFTALAELGDLGPGASALFAYDMYSSVSGPGLNATGGVANVGDPFNFAADPGSVISIPGALPVPEPHAWVLLLLGLAALLPQGATSARRLA